MKKVFLSALMMLFFFGTMAQDLDLAGRKIISGSLNINAISGPVRDVTSINTSLRMGKIKENNRYLALGGSLSYTSDGFTNRVFIGPSFETGKFVKIIDKLYLAPFIGGGFAVGIGDQSGFNANLSASPIRFMYHFTDNFMLSAGFGSAFMNFTSENDITTFNLSASLTNNSNFGVFYTFK